MAKAFPANKNTDKRMEISDVIGVSKQQDGRPDRLELTRSDSMSVSEKIEFRSPNRVGSCYIIV